MTHRRILLASLLVLVLAAGVGVAVEMRRREEAAKVRFEHLYHHIRAGQSREEVRRLMGRPPGHYGKAFIFLPRDIAMLQANARRKDGFDHWYGDDCAIHVYYIDGDRVFMKWIVYPTKPGDPIWY